MSATDSPSFSPELFAFLRELAANNDRTWFKANQARYEAVAKEPALAFVEDLGHRLPQFAPHLVADRRSMFRIHRDTRFARDKSPYKTHVGVYFRHEAAADAETAGLYLHLEPRNVFLGAGIWHPSPPALKRLRDAIVARPDAWRAAVGAAAPEWEPGEGERLKRAPAGFDPGHPLVEDLKNKSFALISRLSQKDATARGFLELAEQRAAQARPYLEFVNGALGVRY